MKGQDVVYKDVIEPLESVSVSLTTTDKKDITEYGSPIEVRQNFISLVASCFCIQINDSFDLYFDIVKRWKTGNA